MMRSISSLQQKRSTKLKNSKNVSTSSFHVTKKTSPKNSTSFLRKINRFAKLSLRALLLSSTFHSAFKIVSVAVLLSGLLYASYFFISKTFANEVIVSQGEIVSRVAKLTPLPEGAPYEIVRVQDEENLREQNSFYKGIEEGDYILMYKDMAVIYDLRNNVIKGVKRAER